MEPSASLLLLSLFFPSATQWQAWAQVYAPIVIHDSRESAPLTSVDALWPYQPRLVGRCADNTTQSLPISQAPFLQDPAVQALQNTCPGELALDFQHAIPPAAATSYYHGQADGRYLYLQYWFFYTWNDTRSLGGGPWAQACGDHEGDWEHVSLRLRRDRLEQAKSAADYRAAVDDVYFSQHHRNQFPGRKYIRPDDPRLSWQGNQLLVYPALGSHASLPRPGTYPLMTVAGIRLEDRNDGAGLRFDLAQGQLLPIAQQPWFGFAGRWGAVRHDGCDWLESVSSLSNDGIWGPGHPRRAREHHEGDWYDVLRPPH
ncbi:MAG: Vps62-related protein [Candidatus Sericytochromatia bacterium]